jgi:hypothetical protein
MALWNALGIDLGVIDLLPHTACFNSTSSHIDTRQQRRQVIVSPSMHVPAPYRYEFIPSDSPLMTMSWLPNVWYQVCNSTGSIVQNKTPMNLQHAFAATMDPTQECNAAVLEKEWSVCMSIPHQILKVWRLGCQVDVLPAQHMV